MATEVEKTAQLMEVARQYWDAMRSVEKQTRLPYVSRMQIITLADYVERHPIDAVARACRGVAHTSVTLHHDNLVSQHQARQVAADAYLAAREAIENS